MISSAIRVHRCLLSVSRSAGRFRSASYSTEVQTESRPLEVPIPSNAEKVFSPKITSLVQDISQLSLFEVADLNECLKKTLRIESVAMAAPAATASPAQVADEEEEAPNKVKTAFTVRLTKFDDTKKVPLIKEIKSIVEGLNLVQAKKFVESAPQVLKANVSKDEAEKMKQTLEALGAGIEIE